MTSKAASLALGATASGLLAYFGVTTEKAQGAAKYEHTPLDTDEQPSTAPCYGYPSPNASTSDAVREITLGS